MECWLLNSSYWFIWRSSLHCIPSIGQNRDADNFSLAGRSVPGWAVGLSVLGTFTSSITFFGLPQKAYAENWNAFLFGAAMPLSAWIATRYLVVRYRRTIRYSVYEFLEDQFGYWARCYAALSYLVLQIIRVAMVLLLVTFAVAPLLDLPIVPSLVLVGVLIIIYDTLGGLRAVIWTDVIQVIVLSVGAIWCLGAVVNQVGGLAALAEGLSYNRIGLGAWDDTAGRSLPWSDWFDLSRGTIFVVFLYGVSEHLRNYGTTKTTCNDIWRLHQIVAHADRCGSVRGPICQCHLSFC